MGNKLFCTFTSLEELEVVIANLSSCYSILYNKIFVLKTEENYLCTYNIDTNNTGYLPNNTILVHRKKESNTLYTINALNELIKSLNGRLDKNFIVDWSSYRNMIILIQDNLVKFHPTQIYKIINL